MNNYIGEISLHLLKLNKKRILFSVEQQERIIEITLSFPPEIAFSQAIADFFFNIQGKNEYECLRAEVYPYMKVYAKVEKHLCHIYISIEDYTTKEGIYIVIDLIHVAVNALTENQIMQYQYTTKDLCTLYSRPTEVYSQYAKQILAKNVHCNNELYSYGLCCYQHRYMYTMRIVISDAIRLYNKETAYESFSVSQEYLQSIPNYISELETLLCSHFTVKEALQYYFSFNKKVQNEKLYLPLKTCDKVNHLEFVCCDFHRSLSIMKMIILQWLNYYYYAYGLHYYALDRRKIYMTSANGLALLAHVAAIDLSSMKDVPADVISIDPSVFRKDPYL